MAQAKKLTKKELNEPDQFQSRGEQILNHVVEYRKRYFTYLAAFVALILAAVIINAVIDSRNAKISEKFSKAMAVFNAQVVKGEDANPNADPPTFQTEDAKFLAASEKFEGFIEEEGGSSYGVVARFFLGACHFQLKQYGKARAAFETFIEDSGSDGKEFLFLAYHNIAQSYDAEDNVEKALETYKKVLGLRDDAFKDQARYYIAKLLKRQGKNDEAVKELEGILADFPETAIKPDVRRMLTVLKGPEKPEDNPIDSAINPIIQMKQGG